MPKSRETRMGQTINVHLLIIHFHFGRQKLCRRINLLITSGPNFAFKHCYHDVFLTLCFDLHHPIMYSGCKGMIPG